MLGLGTTELILIVLAIVLLFGASRLPQLAKSLGQTKKAFREGMKEAEEDDESPSVRQINSAPARSDASALSDEEILAEMQRRSESKSQAT